jgi:phosphonate transport system substrate-binding protein
MPRFTRRAATGLLLALALAGCGQKTSTETAKPVAGAPAELKFSILSAETPASLQPLWEPLLADMSKAIGIPVKPFFASNYSALIEAMRFNQIQGGWFSALSGLEAVRRGGGEVIIRTADPSGSLAYRSVLIVRKGSGITLDKILKCDKTLSYGTGDAKSLSGTLAPATYLFTPRGIDPSTCFKVVRAASHQANMFAVANGVLDVASNNTTGLFFYQRETPQMVAKTEVVWTSPDLPESAIILKSDLDPALKDKIRTFFANYGKATGAEGERQRKVMKGLNWSSFPPADNSYLQPVVQMEAAQKLAEAKRGGDPARIKAAQAALEAANAPGASPKSGQP